MAGTGGVKILGGLAQIAPDGGFGAWGFASLVLTLVALGFLGFKALKKVWSRGRQDPVDELELPPHTPAADPDESPAAPEVEDVGVELEPPAATLHSGLARTRKEGFIAKLRRVLARDLDPSVIEELEEILLTSDIGVHTAQKLFENIREQLSRSELSDGEAALSAIQEYARSILGAVKVTSQESFSPKVLLLVGVNGAGKTTTLGKLASRYKAEGDKVLMVAGDTFRAAAVEQLRVWSERTGTAFHAGEPEADPASVVFDGIEEAVREGYDVVLCDTAGRLHTQINLVEELKKVVRVAGKAMAGAPHEILLVLDATIGQNAIHQARTFTDALGVTGLVLTKLDGTARGGAVLGIVDELRLPIRYVGVGEGLRDLRPFDGEAFVASLFARE